MKNPTLSLPHGLRTPAAIQRFLDEEIRYNKEPDGETALSPRRVLSERRAHCFEGALLAAAALRRLGHAPLVVQLRAVRDDDHVLALFRAGPGAGCWGAVAKSNYSGLRFRSPVYRSLRELVMSYFDCYFNLEGEKSLRSFGRPVDLARFDTRGWETASEDLWDVSTYVATRRFTPLVGPAQARRLPPMDRRLFDAGLVGTLGVTPSGRR
ncbi:MAG: transglutaminase domain-containing protein [Acidobacteriota bacterium]